MKVVPTLLIFAATAAAGWGPWNTLQQLRINRHSSGLLKGPVQGLKIDTVTPGHHDASFALSQHGKIPENENRIDCQSKIRCRRPGALEKAKDLLRNWTG